MKRYRIRGKFVSKETWQIFQREKKERVADKKAPRGRPASARTIQRRKLKAARQVEVFEQRTERYDRSRYTRGPRKGKLKPGYRANSRLNHGEYDLQVTRSGGYEKRVYRFHGVGAWDLAIEILLEQLTQRGWKVTVQTGPGYQRGADWVGSRITSPRQASGWLQTFGQNYKSKGALGPAPGVWVEIIAVRKIGKGRK